MRMPFHATRRNCGIPVHARSGRRGGRRMRRQSGFTLVEVLVATLIMAVSVAAMVSLFRFAFNMTTKANFQGIAYAIGRREMEQVKLAGFDFAPDGTTITNYTNLGSPTGQGQTVVFRATTSVTTYGSPGSYASHRIVTITVTTVQNTADTLYQSGTQLSKAGI